MASALITSERAVRVRALAGDIGLCSWAKLSPHVPTNTGSCAVIDSAYAGSSKNKANSHAIMEKGSMSVGSHGVGTGSVA